MEGRGSLNILRKIRFQEYADTQSIIGLIRRLNPEREVKILNVCGSHEHTICRWGLRSLLPKNIRLIPGPGCPVCVTPQELIVNAIELSRRKDVLVVTYGDMLRVPTSRGTLRDAGGNVAFVTSSHQVLDVCIRNPDKKVVFLSIGFETTAAPVAALFEMGLPDNLYFISAHRLTTAAMRALLDTGLDAFIAPGHVSAVVGSDAWREFPERHKVSVVVAGFTPEDILVSVAYILYCLREGTARLENVYRGVVRAEGNTKAKKLMDKVFDVADAPWRGIGILPASGLELKSLFCKRDARLNLPWEKVEEAEAEGCICSEILLGKALPSQCSLFGRVCTPDSPVGPCMVSQEGACNIWLRFGSW